MEDDMTDYSIALDVFKEMGGTDESAFLAGWVASRTPREIKVSA